MKSHLESASRIATLRETYAELMERAGRCSKPDDAAAFLQMATGLGQEADRIQQDLKIDSCWTYMCMVKRFNYEQSYAAYIEFCARNGADGLAEEDFTRALSFTLDS